ncbi:MAG: DUF2784 family protein [Streptosporangiaceae bacterium]
MLALVELVGFACPLTALQNYLLRRGGQGGYRGRFIAHYLIYPPGLTRGPQVGLGLVVLLIALVGYGGYVRRHRPTRTWRIGGLPADRQRIAGDRAVVTYGAC